MSPCSWYTLSEVSEEFTASIFNVKVQTKKESRKQGRINRLKSLFDFLIYLLSHLEARGSIFFRNQSKLLRDYRMLQKYDARHINIIPGSKADVAVQYRRGF
jgi:hypothetical protein